MFERTEVPFEQDVFDELGLTESLAKQFILESIKGIKLFDKKQRDYGSQNIGDFGYDGVVVRLNDKMKRIVNLYKLGKENPSENEALNESIEDNLRDISNYALIAIMCRKGVWPK